MVQHAMQIISSGPSPELAVCGVQLLLVQPRRNASAAAKPNLNGRKRGLVKVEQNTTFWPMYRGQLAGR